MSTFKATVLAILEFFKVFGPLLSQLVNGLVSLITFVKDFFMLRTQRLRDQVEHEKEEQRRALESQKLKETANVAAFKSIIEEAWKVRYDKIVNLIKEGDYSAVLKMTSQFDNAEVDAILFDVTNGAEYRAMKIIKIMRGQ